MIARGKLALRCRDPVGASGRALHARMSQPSAGLQVNLARVERGVAAVGERDDQAPRCRRSPRRVPRPAAHRAARAPTARLAPAQRVARAPGLERAPLGLRAAARPSAPSSRARAPARCRVAQAERRGRRPQLGGQLLGATATLRPIPSTAQPSCGRPSMRIPASLARSPAAVVPSTTSFGHLMRRLSPATSQTATAAISGSSGGGSAGRATSRASCPRAPSSAGPGVRARRSARRP